MITRQMTDLASAILSGDTRAMARGISVVEHGGRDAASLVGEIFSESGKAFLVGITGAPGAGKSTLVDGLVARWRQSGRTVGVIAVDPTSAFSGGALLGDRVRMQGHARDPGVFIRSMATRGHLGGLSKATADAAVVLDAAGKEIITIETVGVGQDEIEIARTADVAIVVLVPGMGDDVQVMKAGVMEIADIFVVNKGDREGADRMVAEIESLLGLHAYAANDWRPPVVVTEATAGRGLDQLVDAIERFRGQSALVESRRRARASMRLRSIVGDRLMEQISFRLTGLKVEKLIDRIAARALDPYTAADEVLSESEPRAAAVSEATAGHVKAGGSRARSDGASRAGGGKRVRPRDNA
jgi:GTPase